MPHPDVLTTLLQVHEHGHLMDRHGRTFDVTSTLLDRVLARRMFSISPDPQKHLSLRAAA
jgi:hypothetical protein